MKIDRSINVKSKDVEIEGAERLKVRWLIGPDDSAPNFYMRQFTMAPGGCTPRHTHPWEHEVYVVEGRGKIFTADGEKNIAAGDFVFVEGEEIHQFHNVSDGDNFVMLCLVPNSATA